MWKLKLLAGPKTSCWMNIGRGRAMQTHVVPPYIAALWRRAEYRDKLTTEVVHGDFVVANTLQCYCRVVME